ncbi:MAG TPA: type III-B CRISPR-associated protein Cas10/Cmr2, partial [Fimbriimonadales bacterium]|nr:type III-B CRISPR-associated protein Cas10/Cmr2 [Fimbriimonadales bacterium]
LFLYEDELNDAGIELKNACCVRKKFLDKYNDGKSPRPYFAVLHADGDSMGATLKAIDAEVEHFSFSKTLGDFSKAVKGIVEEHCGAPVFAGGDDVVALLPVDTALACAKELHDKFSQMVKGPTLTVGVAFCPTENNLQDCVHFAKKLESEGKKLPGKDALAIGARVRSGSDLIVCGSWKSDLYERFRSVLDLYLNKEIPRGFFADVAELVRLTDGWKEGGYDTEAMNKEFCRIRKRKEPKPPESILESFNLEALRQLHAMLKMGHFLTRSGEEA